MEPDDALLRCMTCGAPLLVAADAEFIAEETFWHRRRFHRELASLDFAIALPSEGTERVITIAAGKIDADQWSRLAQWDAQIANLTAAA